MKESIISLVRIGPGSQPESESLDYLPMPKEMNTYQPPRLPEPEQLLAYRQARGLFSQVLALLDQAANSGEGGMIELDELAPSDLALLNDVLGEGEASAVIELAESGIQIRIQESIFTGVWRLMTLSDGVVTRDQLEVAPVPGIIRQIAAKDSLNPPRPWDQDTPGNIQNAPAIVDEVRHQVGSWQPGQAPHVINLTLLPVTPEDIAFLDHELGTGRILMLSRGYGNCRISNTRLPNCWRVIYYNSFDKVILNTVEVVDMPAVAVAAPEDLRDSRERLAEVIATIGDARND